MDGVSNGTLHNTPIVKVLLAPSMPRFKHLTAKDLGVGRGTMSARQDDMTQRLAEVYLVVATVLHPLIQLTELLCRRRLSLRLDPALVILPTPASSLHCRAHFLSGVTATLPPHLIFILGGRGGRSSAALPVELWWGRSVWPLHLKQQVHSHISTYSMENLENTSQQVAGPLRQTDTKVNPVSSLTLLKGCSKVTAAFSSDLALPLPITCLTFAVFTTKMSSHNMFKK